MGSITNIPASGVGPWLKAKPILLKWLDRARTNQLQHYSAATYYSRLNNWLGIPAVITSAVVGTTVFATLQKQVELKTQLVVGAISVLTAILAALQTFVRYSEKAEKHRSVAASYSAIRKQIEEIGYLPLESRGSLKEFLDGLRAQFDALAQSAPAPPSSVWRAFRKDANYFQPDWPVDEITGTQTPDSVK